jgi:hypothetical protein
VDVELVDRLPRQSWSDPQAPSEGYGRSSAQNGFFSTFLGTLEDP